MFQPNITPKVFLQTCLAPVNLDGHFQLTEGALLVALAGFQQGLFPYPPVCSGAGWLCFLLVVGDRGRTSLFK